MSYFNATKTTFLSLQLYLNRKLRGEYLKTEVQLISLVSIKMH